jgi:hypothetical protein
MFSDVLIMQTIADTIRRIKTADTLPSADLIMIKKMTACEQTMRQHSAKKTTDKIGRKKTADTLRPDVSPLLCVSLQKLGNFLVKFQSWSQG